MQPDTRLIHGGRPMDPETGAVNVPIHQVSTFEQDAPGQDRGYDYARTNNPTREALELLAAELEHGQRGLAFGSGMAAISTVCMLLDSGDHLLVSHDVYGGTYRVLTRVFDRLGLSVTFVDTNEPAALSEALTDDTRALFIETPTNPLLQVTDIEAAATWAKERQLLTIVDNTFLSPYFQNPIPLGADIVVHSATKYLGGHSDLVSGLVVAAEAQLGQRLAFLQKSVGAVPGPWDCWLLIRGIKTLGVRMRAHDRSARAVAEWLSDHSRVEKVYFPGLPDHPGYAVSQRQTTGAGGMLSFVVDSQAGAEAVAENVRWFTLAESLGGVESLLNVPAKMTHASIPPARRAQLGISERLIRLSIGLEDTQDLIEDLEQALAQA